MIRIRLAAKPSAVLPLPLFPESYRREAGAIGPVKSARRGSVRGVRSIPTQNTLPCSSQR